MLFYAAHIKVIDNMLRTHYGLGSSGWNVEQALTSRIGMQDTFRPMIGVFKFLSFFLNLFLGAFQLVEALFGCIPKERLVEKTNPILLAFVGKRVNGIFTKVCSL